MRHHVARHQLWARGAPVVAALSGGADSVAQLLLLHELAAGGEVELAGAAHLNHQLRPEATRDENFCRQLCDRLGVPLIVDTVPVAELAAVQHVSVEVAARRARYAFLEEARRAVAAEHIAVAHTRDDQAETVLMRLLRGTGSRGLRGALPIRGRLVRPLLECARADLRAYLAARGEPWVEDETNADLRHPRNRVRHQLLPLLAQHYRPSVTRVLARTADVASHEDALLEDLAAQALGPQLEPHDGGWRLHVAGLRAWPLALQRRAARQALVTAGARRQPGHGEIERLLDVCARDGRAAAQVAGLRVERFGADAVLLRESAAPLAADPSPEQCLEVPGGVPWPAAGPGCRVTAVGPIKREDSGELSRRRIAVAAAVLRQPLMVRSRRPGDRIQPAGLGGTKTLQDLMVDRKVPRDERHRIPLVVDASGRIVWVVGLAVAAHVAASAQGDVIVLTFVQPAQSGSEAS